MLIYKIYIWGRGEEIKECVWLGWLLPGRSTVQCSPCCHPAACAIVCTKVQLVICLCSTSPQHLPLVFPLTFKVLECCPTELSSVFVLRFNVTYLKIADKYIETSNSTASVLTSLK